MMEPTRSRQIVGVSSAERGAGPVSQVLISLVQTFRPLTHKPNLTNTAVTTPSAAGALWPSAPSGPLRSTAELREGGGAPALVLMLGGEWEEEGNTRPVRAGRHSFEE